MGKKFVLVDNEDIMDYINGDCSQRDMFERKHYRIKTTNAHNEETYRQEFEDYMKEWGNYDD